MKKVLLSLVVVSGLLMADQAGNKAACEGIQKSLPLIYEPAMDYFEIMDGKKSNCEEHPTPSVWSELGVSTYFGHMIDLKGNNAAAYEKVVTQAKKASIKDVGGLEKIILKELGSNYAFSKEGWIIKRGGQ